MNAPITVFTANPNDNESQTRHLLSRIENLEKSLLEIHSTIASYVIKIAKTRDMGDILAMNLLKFTETESLNTSLRHGLTNFANCLNAIQDYRDDQVKHIEEKVINELSIYGELTRRAKEELKFNSSARDKQSSKDSKIKDLVRSNSLSEVPNALTAYDLQIQRFEMKKICDLKRTFLEITKSELLFHSKTIELLTKAYKHLLSIDADKDLQDFCTFFKLTQLGSPKREESIKSSNNESIETTFNLRRFNSVPSFGSDITIIDGKSNETENDSKNIQTFIEHLGN